MRGQHFLFQSANRQHPSLKRHFAGRRVSRVAAAIT
jgi:hypothetical protein